MLDKKADMNVNVKKSSIFGKNTNKQKSRNKKDTTWLIRSKSPPRQHPQWLVANNHLDYQRCIRTTDNLKKRQAAQLDAVKNRPKTLAEWNIKCRQPRKLKLHR